MCFAWQRNSIAHVKRITEDSSLRPGGASASPVEIIQCQLLCDSIAVQQIIWCIVRRVHDKLLHDFRWAIGRNKLMTSRRRAGIGGDVLRAIPTSHTRRRH